MNNSLSIVCFIGLTLASSLAYGDSGSSVMIVHGVHTSGTPSRSIWNGASWSSPAVLPSVGAEVHWVVLRNCPTRNETACGIFDVNSDVNVTFCNGSSWTGVTELTIEGDENDDRNVDIAYEHVSGDCLIVYYDTDEDNFGYRTYNGSTLSGEYDLARAGVTGNDYIGLYQKPKTNQIVMVTIGQVSGDGNVISANIWDGSSWLGWNSIETSAVSNDDEAYGFAFESLTGDGLLVYGESGQNQPCYRVLTGTLWSAESLIPSVGAVPWWKRLASDPVSNQILFAALDEQNDINVNVWNGSSWGSNLEVETNAPAHDKRCFDIAYEPDGTNALLTYAETAQDLLRYRTWNGSSWSSEINGTDIQCQGATVQLRTGSSGREIFVAASDDCADIELMRWDGSMSPKTRIEDDMGALPQCEPFMICVPSKPSKVAIRRWYEVPNKP